MSHSIRRKALLLLLILPLLAWPAAAVTPCESELAKARAWLDTTGWLPGTPDDLVVVPARERSLIVSLLPAEVRSNLWRTFFEEYIADHPDLSGDQKRVLEEAIRLATPTFFSTAPHDLHWSKAVKQPIDRLLRQAREVFSEEAVHTILFNMGNKLEEAPTDEPIPDQQVNLCDCRVGLGNCVVGNLSLPCKAVSCITQPGCGPMRNLQCDGKCTLDAQAGDPEPIDGH